MTHVELTGPGKEDVSNEARLNFDKACSAFVVLFLSTNDASHEEISSKTSLTVEQSTS